jgi:hypothetical protein
VIRTEMSRCDLRVNGGVEHAAEVGAGDRAETTAAFDQVTGAGLLPQVEQGPETSRRPDEIRAGYFIPAVDFIQANRLRMRVMQQLDAAFGDLDLFIGGNNLLTNRTGHACDGLPLLSRTEPIFRFRQVQSRPARRQARYPPEPCANASCNRPHD